MLFTHGSTTNKIMNGSVLKVSTLFRDLDKTVLLKMNSLISQPKHRLWVLIRTW